MTIRYPEVKTFPGACVRRHGHKTAEADESQENNV
jgi:hypothetical protein